MSLCLVNIIGCSQAIRERVEYLAALSSIQIRHAEFVGDCTSKAEGQNAIIIVEANTAAEIDNHLQAASPRHRFVLITQNANLVLRGQDALGRFFEKGGIAVLETGWNDDSLTKIFDELEKTNGRAEDMDIECTNLLTLYVENNTYNGYTAFLGQNRVRANMFQLPTAAKEATFSLRLNPLFSVHGKCKITDSSKNNRHDTTFATFEVVEFDGISRDLMHAHISNLYSYQEVQKSNIKVTDGEHLRFLSEELTPFATSRNAKICPRPSQFDQAYLLSGRQWLMAMMSRWICEMLISEDHRLTASWISLQLREMHPHRAYLVLSISIPNSIQIRIDNHGILVGESIIKSILRESDIATIHNLGLCLEQFPSELHEHLAVCLENRQ